MLITSFFLGTISCSFIQKTKCYFPYSSCLSFYSLFVNMISSALFCISFTDIRFPMSLWVGMFSFLGADTLYKTLEGKLSSYNDIIERRRNNHKNKR